MVYWIENSLKTMQRPGGFSRNGNGCFQLRLGKMEEIRILK